MKAVGGNDFVMLIGQGKISDLAINQKRFVSINFGFHKGTNDDENNEKQKTPDKKLNALQVRLHLKTIRSSTRLKQCEAAPAKLIVVRDCYSKEVALVALDFAFSASHFS
jgi:hypothetical protein